MNYKKKIVYGLSIAIICVSGVCILFQLIALIYTFIGFGVIQDNEFINNFANTIKLGYETSFVDGNIIIGTTSIPLKDLLGLGLGFILTITMFTLLCTGFSLATGIIGVVNYQVNKQLRIIFCFDVASSVASLLSLNFINLVLSVVCAIFSHKAETDAQDDMIKISEIVADQPKD